MPRSRTCRWTALAVSIQMACAVRSKPETILISVMHANNEVGTIQPIEEISRIAREHEIPLHSDAAQSVGKIRTKVRELGVDLMSVAGHKLYGPKGVGALYVRTGIQLEPLIHGAGHERRAGTENVLLNVGLGAACEVAESWTGNRSIEKLRDLFWSRLAQEFEDGVLLNGHPTQRLPNTLNVSFPGRIGGDILHSLQDVAASTGSACHSGSVRLSPVLEAMRISPADGMGAIRFSLGRTTTEEEIEDRYRRPAGGPCANDTKRHRSRLTVSMNAHELRESVRSAYSAAASDPSGKHPFPVGPDFARDLGYPQELLSRIPDESVEAFAGVSAVSLQAQLREGLTVLDLGCGAGLDSLVAAERVGPTGCVIGVDFSPSHAGPRQPFG